MCNLPIKYKLQTNCKPLMDNNIQIIQVTINNAVSRLSVIFGCVCYEYDNGSGYLCICEELDVILTCEQN